MKHGWIAGAAAAVLGLGGASAPLALVFETPASASVPSYRLSASGTGMQLTLDGHTLVAATSTVAAGNGAPVVAAAAGELSPTHVSSQRATAASPGASQTDAQVCTAHPSTSFPAPFSTAVRLDAACSAASAHEAATGLPGASASGSVASLAIAPVGGGATPAGSLRAILPTPVTPGSAAATGLSGVLGQLPPLPKTGLPLATVVQQVATKQTGASLNAFVDATLGPSASAITTSAGVLSARSVDTGATVALLTGTGAGGGPLLTVDIGRAVAAAQVELSSGKVTEAATAASVSVTVAPPAGTRQTVSITPGASRSFFTGTPLQTTVSVSAPSITAKSGRASSSGVVIDLAQPTGAGGGSGVVLDLGASSAQAAATAPTPAPPARQSAAGSASSGTVPFLAGATTVHTGEPWAGPLPIALLTLSLFAGIGLLARRHLLGIVHRVAHAAGRLARPRGR